MRRPDQVGPPQISLRTLGPADVDVAAGVLGRAFADNPSWSAMLDYLAPPARARAVTTMNGGFVRATLAQGEVTGCFVEAELAGVSLVLPPGRYPFRAGAFRHLVTASLRWKTLRAIPRLLAMDAWQTRNHLKEPHYYLFVLGVEPSFQGRGLGGALLGKIDEACDRERVAAYLETDKEENLAVYRRHRYEVVHEETLAMGVPLRMWTMRRDPI